MLLGATGSGKTSITKELDPDRYEVVGCDSRQIYRDMEIGTACPSDSLRRRLRHHLVACVSPSEVFSAGRYAELAREALREILLRGREPLIVGGTGFYYQALRTGLFGGTSSEAGRREVLQMAPEERLERLRAVDPGALVPPENPGAPGRIHPNDEYRVSRALETYISTGILWSEHWRLARERLGRTQDGEFCFEGWTLARTEDWEQGLLQRARNMLEDGMILEAQEVQGTYGADCPGLRTLGYDLALLGLEGVGGAERFVAELARKHRQYGRRQQSWFRRERGLTAADRDTIVRELGSV